ncbi:MAG: DUF4352 domain-containing protein [Dehalococcoidales bacterium]
MKKLLISLTLVALIVMPGCGLTGSPNYTTPITIIVTSTTPSYPTTSTAPTTTPVTTPPYSDTNIPTSTLPAGFFLDNPVPLGQSAVNAEGIQITVVDFVTGDDAWEIIKNANSVNVPPDKGMQYILITIKLKNVSSREEPYMFWGTYFDLVGGSGKVFHAYDINIIYPTKGIYQKLEGELNHGDEVTGSVHFYVPQNETGLTLVWSDYYGYNKLYFAIK